MSGLAQKIKNLRLAASTDAWLATSVYPVLAERDRLASIVTRLANGDLVDTGYSFPKCAVCWGESPEAGDCEGVKIVHRSDCALADAVAWVSEQSSDG